MKIAHYLSVLLFSLVKRYYLYFISSVLSLLQECRRPFVDQELIWLFVTRDIGLKMTRQTFHRLWRKSIPGTNFFYVQECSKCLNSVILNNCITECFFFQTSSGVDWLSFTKQSARILVHGWLCPTQLSRNQTGVLQYVWKANTQWTVLWQHTICK